MPTANKFDKALPSSTSFSPAFPSMLLMSIPTKPKLGGFTHSVGMKRHEVN